jgi:hypothetical protein
MQVDDEYARKHMSGEGEVLWFDKRTVPRWMRNLMAGTMAGGAAVVVGAGLASGTPDLLALVPVYAVGAMLQVLFWTLRTTVTRKSVHIQYGLYGPKIAVDDIVSAEVVAYDWKSFGGWGIRRRLRDGTVAFNMLGDQGRAVKLTYRDGGKTKTLLVSAGNPNALCGAVLEAMGKVEGLADVKERLGVKGIAEEDAVAAVEEVEALLKR